MQPGFFTEKLNTYKKSLAALEVSGLSDLNEREIMKLGDNLPLVELGIEVLELNDNETSFLMENIELVKLGMFLN
ncbi:TPA: hypothetical protein ACTXXA_003642 [Legionella anisa]